MLFFSTSESLGQQHACNMCMQVAVACIKIASQAVSTMPMLLFWPLLPFLAFVALVVYWVAVVAYLYSAGSITPVQLTSSPTPYTLSVRPHFHELPKQPLHVLFQQIRAKLQQNFVMSNKCNKVAVLGAQVTALNQSSPNRCCRLQKPLI